MNGNTDTKISCGVISCGATVFNQKHAGAKGGDGCHCPGECRSQKLPIETVANRGDSDRTQHANARSLGDKRQSAAVQ